MTVRELLSTIDSHELSEWIAYANVEPFGEDREDIRHGIRTAVTANSAFGSTGKFKPSDFMPRFSRSRITAGEARQGFASYAAAFTGRK